MAERTIFLMLLLFLYLRMSIVDGGSVIILEDDFESEGYFDKWDRDGTIGPSEIKITTGPANIHRGRKAVEFTAPVGSTGSKLVKWFMPGYDRVYARWYMKFDASFDQGNFMHLNHLLGNRTDNKWSAFGTAGTKPDGTDFFTTGLDPWRDWGRNPPPGKMVFYTYYPDMVPDAKGNYWGEMFSPSPKFVPVRGQWYCMEMMVKVNTVTPSVINDGEQTFWIDGQEIGRWTGLRWRESDILRINCFWLMLYVHDASLVNKVWYDDVKISTERIGCLADDHSKTTSPKISELKNRGPEALKTNR